MAVGDLHLEDPKEALNVLYWANVRLILDYTRRGLTSSALSWNRIWLKRITAVHFPERDIEKIIYLKEDTNVVH